MRDPERSFGSRDHQKRDIAVVCDSIDSGINKTQFQRLSLLLSEYNVHVYAKGEVADVLAARTSSISHCPGQRFGLSKVIHAVWAAYRIWRLSRAVRLEFVYTTFPSQDIIAGFLLKTFGFVWVADLWDEPLLAAGASRSSASLYRRVAWVYHSIMLKVVTRVLKYADLIIIALVPDILRFYGVDPQAKNVLSVTNGVDLSLTYPKRDERSYDSPMRVLYVGPIRKARGLDVLIEAVKIMQKDSFVCEIKLIGGARPEDLRWLEETIHREGLASDCIQLLGELSHSATLEEIAKADICLCLLSQTVRNYCYAYPIKIFEYMAMNRPIICTRLFGTEQILKHEKTGLLIPPDDGHALAHGIMKLANDKQLRNILARNARIDVQNYSWSDINCQIRSRMRMLVSDKA